MKGIAAFLAALLLAAPVFAKTKVPEAELMKGLIDLSVCMQTNLGAINKLGQIIQSMASSDTNLLEDERHNLEKAMADHNNLKVFLGAESFMGAAIVSHLVDDYAHTLDDLNVSLKEVVHTTHEEMDDLLKDVKDYDEFNVLFIPKLNHCTTVIEQIGNLIDQLKEEKSPDKPLEKEKGATILVPFNSLGKTT